MPVRVSDHLADTLYLGVGPRSAFCHFPLEILDGGDVVLASITGSAPNAWNSRAVPADVLEIHAGHWHIAANPQSNPNKASLAARDRWTATVAAKVIAVDACLRPNSATGIARCALVPGDATSKSRPGSAL
jgi:hypothetical protein